MLIGRVRTVRMAGEAERSMSDQLMATFSVARLPVLVGRVTLQPAAN